MRIPAGEMTHAQWRQFQFTSSDSRDFFGDSEVTKNPGLCVAAKEVLAGNMAVVYLEDENARIFVTEKGGKTMELSESGEFTERKMELIFSEEWKREIPVIHPRCGRMFRGNLSTLVDSRGSSTALPIGSYNETVAWIRSEVPREYRRLCSDAFVKLAGKEGSILTNETVTITVPYFAAKPLFPANSLPRQVFEPETPSDFFTSFASLRENEGSQFSLHFPSPVSRDLRCVIDTSFFRGNRWFRERVRNDTHVGEDPLGESSQGEGEDTVYRVGGKSVRELRFRIEAADREEPVAVSLLIPAGELAKKLMDGCEDGGKPVGGSFTAPSNLTETPSTAELLMDSYGGSLIFTNLLFIKEFGKDERKVPAHMPHLLNTHTLAALFDRFPAVVNATRSHRFRQKNDLQLAFAYFHYLREIEKSKKGVYFDDLWSRYLDTNHDGMLEGNELRTLAAVVYHDDVNQEYFCVYSLK